MMDGFDWLLKIIFTKLVSIMTLLNCSDLFSLLCFAVTNTNCCIYCIVSLKQVCTTTTNPTKQAGMLSFRLPSGQTTGISHNLFHTVL